MNTICLKIDKYGCVSIARKWRTAYKTAICCPHNVYPCSADCPLFDLTIKENEATVTFHCGTGATYNIATFENEAE